MSDNLVNPQEQPSCVCEPGSPCKLHGSPQEQPRRFTDEERHALKVATTCVQFEREAITLQRMLAEAETKP